MLILIICVENTVVMLAACYYIATIYSIFDKMLLACLQLRLLSLVAHWPSVLVQSQ